MQFRVIVLAMAMLVLSAAPASSVRIIGYGLLSCGEWTDGRRTQGVDNVLHASWALGYLSGINEAVSAVKKADILVHQDAHGLLAWIDNYCRSNPLDKIKVALDALVNELLKRANVK